MANVLSSLYHPLINFHTLASFWKRQVPISAGCIQIENCHKNHRSHKKSTSKSKHGTTKWNESTPVHVIASCYCIILHPPKLQGTQATSLRLVPASSVFCTEFTSLRIKCLMAFTLFSLAASRMSRPRIPFKSKILCKRSDAWTCLESLKAPNQALEEQ